MSSGRSRPTSIAWRSRRPALGSSWSTGTTWSRPGAGVGSAFPDSAYAAVGARIATVEEVWETVALLLKVKEPLPEEYARLREGLVLFTYLHLAADEA